MNPPANYTIPEAAEAYIRYWSRSEGDTDITSEWAEDLSTELIFDEPENAYQLVEAVIARSDDEKVLSMLGVGPIEDLLCNHGPAFVDRILDNARKWPRWREALGSVWISGAKDPDVRERVLEAQKRYFS